MNDNVDPKDFGTLLRCRISRRYVAEDGWTEDPGEAKAFPNEDEAMRSVITNGLQNIEVVVRAPGSNGEVAVTPAIPKRREE